MKMHMVCVDRLKWFGELSVLLRKDLMLNLKDPHSMSMHLKYKACEPTF